MNIVVVGANGFVGPHLIEKIISTFPEARVLGTYLPGTETVCLERYRVHLASMDITDTEQVQELLGREKPDYLVNLAAQSSVGFSWKNPVLTFQVNVMGTLNLLQGLHVNELGTRVLLIGSSEEYESGKNDLSENTAVEPSNPYGLSKTTQEGLGRLYGKRYGIPVVMTRSFNHTGPGQMETFVIPDWCRQIVTIEQGKAPPVISVGNLKVQRDFSHVADIVTDYVHLMSDGESGEAYNVGSGSSHGLDEILEMLIGLSYADIDVRIDEQRFRPADNEIVLCNRNKLDRISRVTYRPIKETLSETLNYWREKQKQGQL